MNAEKQYIDIFTQYEELINTHGASVLNGPRKQALADFQKLGFPAVTDEDYKYTDVPAAFAPDYGLNLNRLSIPVNPYNVFRCDVPNLSTALYFVVNDSFYDEVKPSVTYPEGVYVGGLRTFAEQHPGIAARYYGQAAQTGHDGLIALNTMLAQDGFVV